MAIKLQAQSEQSDEIEIAPANSEDLLQEYFSAWKEEVIDEDRGGYEFSNLIDLGYFELLSVFKERESLEQSSAYKESDAAKKLYRSHDATLYFSCLGYTIFCEDTDIYEEDSDLDFVEISKGINEAFSIWFKENAIIEPNEYGQPPTLLDWLNSSF